MTTGPARPAALRAAIWPLREIANAYWPILYDRVAAQGVVLEEFTPGRAARERFDLIHVHFPDKPFAFASPAKTVARLAATMALLGLARARGASIVWTAHNLASHERRHERLERAFMAWFTKRVDLLIGLSAAGVAAATATYPALGGVATVVLPHPHYRGAYPDEGLAPAAARRRLDLPEEGRLALAIGQIRPYKNAPLLARMFRAAAPEGWRLAIAGLPRDAALGDEIREATANDPRISLALDFVPDADLHLWLRAADVVILPYREIANSGAALLALSFDRPVAVTDRPALRELEATVGSAWLRPIAPLDEAVLRDALAWAETARAERPNLAAFDPEAIARGHVEAYANLVSE